MSSMINANNHTLSSSLSVSTLLLLYNSNAWTVKRSTNFSTEGRTDAVATEKGLNEPFGANRVSINGIFFAAFSPASFGE